MPSKGVITFAAWLKAENRDIKIVRPFKAEMPSSKAELMALANALYLADQQFDLAQMDLRLVFDYVSMFRVRMIKDGSRPRTKHQKKHQAIQQFIQPYLDKANTVNYQRVKGHNGEPKTIDERMHKWCDIQSRKLAKQLIKDKAPAVFKVWPDAEILS